MAAGKTLRVKLRYRSRLLTTGFSSKEGEDHIKETSMASGGEPVHEPVMQHHPLDPLQTSFQHGNPGSIPPPQMMPLTSAAILSQRRRRKNSQSLKRSASTPNVRGLANSDSGMTIAEKRRNKLGYHRTSVACGHCRRRKIRCLLAPDDAQNRCANCIRLKKDCNFFPVDQQPQFDRRPRASSKADTRGSTSSESSPALVGGHLPEEYHTYSQLSAPFLSSRGSIAGELVSPMTRAPLTSQGFEFPQHSRTSWGSPFPDVATSGGHSSPGDASHFYWGRHAESPMTPGFSPHLSGPASSLHSASDNRSSFTSFAPSAPSRSDSAWSMPGPARSMSYGLVEDLHLSNQSHYHHPQQPSMELRRRASLMNPPSLQTSNNSSTTSINEAHMTPLSAPAVSTPPIQHWMTPITYAPISSSTFGSKGPDYGSWYGEPPLAKVQEEEHYGSEPAILYAAAEHAGV